MAWDNVVVEQHGSGCNPRLESGKWERVVGARKMAGWSYVACDNIFVKWHSNGCNPSLKVANGKVLVGGQIDWAGSYDNGQENRIGELAKLDHQGWSNCIGFWIGQARQMETTSSHGEEENSQG